MGAAQTEVLGQGLDNYWWVPVGSFTLYPARTADITVGEERRHLVNQRPFMSPFKKQQEKPMDPELAMRRQRLLGLIRRGDGHGGRLDDVDTYRNSLLDIGITSKGMYDEAIKSPAPELAALRDAAQVTYGQKLEQANALAQAEDRLWLASDLPGNPHYRTQMALGRLVGFALRDEYTYGIVPVIGLKDGTQVELPGMYREAFPFLDVTPDR